MFDTLGVPDPARGLLFDLDGVLTQTAKQHAAAWKLMFDEFLAQRAKDTGEMFVPFDSGADYDTHVDGKPRLAGTQSFLASRRIELPAGTPHRERLAGKPAPDTFLAGARLLGVPPDAAVVFEDALAGVAAGRAGHFGYVVGVDRVGQADALRAHGADVVVGDLAELLDRS